MIKHMSVEQVQAELEAIFDAFRTGELVEIIVTENGEPAARMLPY
jgi:antitoxin (DNA-binding transcriptional repressor) of toxin-antitoxin stability system